MPSEEQIALLERHSVDLRCRHVEASRAEELLNQDTFFWGSLKGVGKVYVQVVVDVFCSLAFAKVYTSKMPVTACDLLYERVLPFYEALGVEVGAVLTDNVPSSEMPRKLDIRLASWVPFKMATRSNAKSETSVCVQFTMADT